MGCSCCPRVESPSLTHDHFSGSSWMSCVWEMLSGLPSPTAIPAVELVSMVSRVEPLKPHPGCAANLALVRQYLMEGWFNAGVQDVANGLTSPSAALLKAMAVASAQPTREFDTVPYLEQYPNIFTGYGYVSLGHVLMFDDSPHRLFFADRESVDEDTAVEYCFQVTGDGVPLTVAIAWAHPPALTNAASLLANNLDLIVVDPSSTFYYGNHRTHTDDEKGEKDVRDTLNKGGEGSCPDSPGYYSVRVVGPDVPDGPQNVSVVSMGAMTCVDISNSALLMTSVRAAATNTVRATKDGATVTQTGLARLTSFRSPTAHCWRSSQQCHSQGRADRVLLD